MKLTIRLLGSSFALLVGWSAHAQNIGINVNGTAPDPSALLDVDGSGLAGAQRGVLIPRMTAAQRLAIPAPATGLLVYGTTSQAFWYYDGTAWKELLHGGTGWRTEGNTGTVDGTNFLGTVETCR